MIWARLIPVVALLAAIPGVAEAQLVTQSVVGTRRICAYINPDPVARQRTPFVRYATGRGEPCPARYPLRSAGELSVQIPSMATFLRERRVGMQRYCDYQYLGRIYARPVGATEYCPRTPHFP